MVRFWIVTGILCAAGFALYYRYFQSGLRADAPWARRSCSGSRARGRRRGAALERRGVRGRRAADRDARERRRRRRCSTASDLLVKSPGVPGEAPLVVAARARGDPGLERDRARLPAARAPARRRHRHERQDDDDRAARRDAPRAPVAVQRRPGNVGRPLDGAVEPRRAGRLRGCRASSSRTSHAFRPAVAVLLNLEPDHLDRHGTLRGATATRSSASSRTSSRATSRSCRAASAGAGRGAPGRVRCRRPAAGRAADPGRAQPRERRRRDGRRPRGRVADEAIARGARDLPGRRAPARARRASCDGVRCVNDSKATNVAAAAARRSPPTPTGRCA